MARGWESKAVEEQVNDRDAAHREADRDAVRLTDAERDGLDRGLQALVRASRKPTAGP